jgi:hypothetical protein
VHWCSCSVRSRLQQPQPQQQQLQQTVAAAARANSSRRRMRPTALLVLLLLLCHLLSSVCVTLWTSTATWSGSHRHSTQVSHLGPRSAEVGWGAGGIGGL